jgi:hypothetical protein
MARAPKYWLGFASLAALSGCGGGPGIEPEETGESTASLSRAGALSDGLSARATTPSATTARGVATILTAPLIPEQGSDLTLDDSIMHFDAGSQQGLDIHVINEGALATRPAAAAVTVNGIRFIGHIYPYYPATSPTDSLVPYTHGYIHLDIPAATLQLNPCTPYNVHIDVDHTMQSAYTASPDVFSNDVGYSWTECLTWLTPVTSSVMGEAIVSPLAGNTLHQVVSSYVSARVDTKLCSDCHYRDGTGTNYRPEIDQSSSEINILADTVVDGATWEGGPESWSYKFLTAPYAHTDELHAAVTRWREDLERQRFGELQIITGSVTVTSAQISAP